MHDQQATDTTTPMFNGLRAMRERFAALNLDVHQQSLYQSCMLGWLSVDTAEDAWRDAMLAADSFIASQGSPLQHHTAVAR